MLTKKLRWKAGWLPLDLARLLLLGVPLAVAYAVLMTWVPTVSRPTWMMISTAALAVTCLVLLWPTLRDTPKTLGTAYLAFFLTFVSLFTLVSDLDLLAGPRTPLAGFDAERPPNVLGLGGLGDWHYAVIPGVPAEGRIVVVTLPSFDGERREDVRRTLRFLIAKAREHGARGVAFDLFLEKASAYDLRLRREIEAAQKAGLPVVFGYRQVEKDGLLIRMPLAPELDAVVPAELRGHLQGYQEADGMVRLIPAVLPEVGEHPALSVVVAELLRGEGLDLPRNRLLRFLPPAGGVAVKEFDPQLDWNLLRDRFVFVGTSSDTDRVKTPFGEARGVVVHAWAAHSLATDTALVDVDPRLTLPLVFVFCFVLTARHARGLGRRRVLVAAVGLSALLVGVAVTLAGLAHLWLEVSYPLVALWLLTALLVSLRGVRRRLGSAVPRLFAPASDPVDVATAEGVARVFLSHNSRDKPVVREIDDALTERGLSTWFDEERFEPGHRWQNVLDEALLSCSAFVVLIGPHGMGPWQDLESDAAVIQHVKRGVRVIPVFLPGSDADFALEPILQQFQAVDMRDGLSDEVVDRLEWVITGRRPGSRSPHDEPDPSSPPAAAHP